MQEHERLINEIKNIVSKYYENNFFSGHEYSHSLRVYNLCRILAEGEEVDEFVLEAAALLHDLGREWERRDPSIDHAEKSVELAQEILNKIGFPKEKISQVLYAIKVHRFSKGVKPETIEAKILQDADRIDVCGAIGIATAFAYGGAYGLQLYDIDDPFAENRPLNDKKYCLDHFYTKLLNLDKTLNTKRGKMFARKRKMFLIKFLKEF
ncbi:MAG: HD domain-containing protein, partial [Nitrososphaeria archaeon]|nr:HD domain-containing protein [Nitrososphaeria archaeon]